MEIFGHVKVAGSDMKRAEKRGCRLKTPPTMITPSADTKPFKSRFISSKNSTDDSAAVPWGIASYILMGGLRTRTQFTQVHVCICVYLYSYIYFYIYIYINL